MQVKRRRHEVCGWPCVEEMRSCHPSVLASCQHSSLFIAAMSGHSSQSCAALPAGLPRTRCRCTGDCPCAAAKNRCAWCDDDDTASSEIEDTASGGGCCAGKACGVGSGKCGCCGQGAGGGGHGGGGGSSDGGGGNNEPDAGSGNSGANKGCGGSRAGPGGSQKPSGGGACEGSSSPGSAGSSGGSGGCCGRQRASSPGSGAPNSQSAAPTSPLAKGSLGLSLLRVKTGAASDTCAAGQLHAACASASVPPGTPPKAAARGSLLPLRCSALAVWPDSCAAAHSGPGVSQLAVVCPLGLVAECGQ